MIKHQVVIGLDTGQLATVSPKVALETETRIAKAAKQKGLHHATADTALEHMPALT